MSVKTANGPFAYAQGADTPDQVLTVIGAPLTLTTNPAGVTFIAAITSYILRLDLSAVRQVRLTGIVSTVSASAATPVLRAAYFTSASTTASNYLQLGSGAQVQFSTFTGSFDGDSGWLDIAPAARIPNAYVGFFTVGGDGVASPVVNQVSLHLR
jgi:hypothetical protein